MVKRKFTFRRPRTYRRKFRRMRRKVRRYGYNFARYKLRYLANVASDVSGEFIRVLSTSDPEAAVDGAGVYNDWTNLEGLWDSYRVTGLKVRYVPAVPSDESSTTAYRALYMVKDEDDTAAPTSTNQMIQYPNVVIRDMSKPFSKYWRVSRKTVTGNPLGWMNIGSAGSATNQISGIKCWADGLTASKTYGQFILTIYLKTKGGR